MVRVPVLTVLPAGVVVEFMTSEAGVEYAFRNVEDCYISMRNIGEVNVHATFYTQRLFDELKVKDRTVQVTPGQLKVAGPFMGTIFNDTLKDVRFDFDGAGVLFAVYHP